MQKILLTLLIGFLTVTGFSQTTVTIRDFDITYHPVVYNNDGTSTWKYVVSGTNQGKDLSHWDLGFCADFTAQDIDEVLVDGTIYTGWTVQNDPSAGGFFGLKFNVPVLTTQTKTFKFTMNIQPAVGDIEALVKSGPSYETGFIPGPICDIVSFDSGIGDYVWYDNNRNGTQDQGEAGVPGVTVFLYDCQGNQLDYTVTDSDGLYLFDELTPGDYSIKFDLSTLPSGYVVTAKDAGSDDIDSDADPVTGKTICTTLEGGETDLTWDMGIYKPTASLGDYVWHDENQDGIQDDDEYGVEGVTVELYDCDGNFIATTTTGTDGYYGFYELVPGDYSVKFVLPNGYFFSPKDQGQDDAIDSDADPSTGITMCYFLEADEHNPTIDAGIFTEENADLELVKTGDVEVVHDGDLVIYTIQVTNNGPEDATNVEVTDQLPSDVIYQSHATADGSYDPNTGIWDIGTILSGSMATLTITVEVDVELVNNSFIDLGPATGFNLFVLFDLEQPSSDTEGKAAVGRNAILANYSVGDKLPLSGGTVDVLVVGRNLTYTSGRVYSGNVVYGNTTNLPVHAVSYLDGTLRKDYPIDFPAARTYLRTLSTDLKTSYAPNGTVTNTYGTLFLVGTDPVLNVFQVDGNDLSAANNVDIDVPAGSVVLVNISRRDVSWSGGLTVHNTDISNVLYNFYQARNLHISGIDVQGSILAPRAVLDFPAGVVNGQVICKSMYGSGQFNNTLFMGHIPTEYEFVNVAEVTGVDQDDPDSSPNNGDPEEDDYGMFAITVVPETDAPGWAPEGTLAGSEAFLTITNDAAGNLVAGTADGNVYRSYNGGADWISITSDLDVAQVWTLASNNGTLYAATSNGIYTFDASNESWTLTGLNGIDIRDILFDGSTIYAAGYGQGVYRSNDGMISWTQLSSNLPNLNVQALAIAGTDIIAATYGGGIARLDEGAANWIALDAGFAYIRSLAVTDNNVIYAGTYGDGMLRSNDNGNSWVKVNKDLPAKFIYNVAVDAANNVYVNTLQGGIYVLESNVANWTSMGMSGRSISALFFNTIDNTLYAGTKDGALFSNIDGVTSTDDETTLPVEFELSQNYPNPFNPSTTINFSIAKEGSYTLAVYNLLGEKVVTLIDENLSQGTYNVTLNASSFTSGVYFYRLTGDNNVNFVKKMMLLK